MSHVTAYGTIKLDNPKDIRKAIGNQAAAALTSRVRKNTPKVLSNIKDKLREALIDCHEFALLKSKHYGEFGMPDIDARMGAVVNALVDTVRIDFNGFSFKSNKLAGKVKLLGCPASNREVLQMSEAYLVSDGGTFPWFEALIDSNSVAIPGFWYADGIVDTSYSRTGEGVMLKRTGATWKVPLDLYGSPDANFITGAIASIYDFVAVQMRSLLS